MKKFWLLMFFVIDISMGVYATHLRPSYLIHHVGVVSPVLEITSPNSSIANLSLEVVRRFVENINTVKADESKVADKEVPADLSTPAVSHSQFDVYSTSLRLLLAIAFSAFLFLYLLKTLPKLGERNHRIYNA